MPRNPKGGRPPLPPQRVKHGTMSGVAWHLKNNQKVAQCPACRNFLNAHRREERRKQRIHRKFIYWALTNPNSGGQPPDMNAKELDEVVRSLRKHLKVTCYCDKQKSEPTQTADGSTTSDTPSD